MSDPKANAASDKKDEKTKNAPEVDDAKKKENYTQKALAFRQSNTLHGFNVMNGGGECVLGIMSWDRILDGEDPGHHGMPKRPPEPADSVIEALIRKRFSAEVLPEDKENNKYRFVGSYYGGDILCCPFSMREKSGELIDFVREQGYRIQLQTKLAVCYRSADVKTNPFSKENTEKRAVRDLKCLLKQPNYSPGYHPVSCYESYAVDLCDTRLWYTPEGKEVAVRLKAHFPAKNKENGEDKPGGPVVYGLCDGDLKQCAHDFPPIGTHKTGDSVPSSREHAGDKRGAGTELTSQSRAKRMRIVLPMITCPGCQGAGEVSDEEEGDEDSSGEDDASSSQKSSSSSEPEKEPTRHECEECGGAGKRRVRLNDFCIRCKHKDLESLEYGGMCRACYWKENELCCFCGDEACKESIERVAAAAKKKPKHPSANDHYFYCADCYEPLR